VTEGRRRFRLRDLDCVSAPYLIASVEWVDDDPVAPSGGMADRLATVARAVRVTSTFAVGEGNSQEVPLAIAAHP